MIPSLLALAWVLEDTEPTAGFGWLCRIGVPYRVDLCIDADRKCAPWSEAITTNETRIQGSRRLCYLRRGTYGSGDLKGRGRRGSALWSLKSSDAPRA